ncbi:MULTISPECIES: MarR family winged helix-turn-helix transcriptional regulator [unclassified Pseudonocardia]|uniref:MarR family winged helix-turn-helix transcriptional regulator n=1 Tax=unclassified Pseudonocardia TaxID=2619320 RepID=UPI00095AF317|nr:MULTISPECIES: MarR family winged helix-turn-helix transcriptional regulator [unclassified Pseudonocardia]MBN9100162.1 winged helix-turn-helix transcriptional regulator [Pseudonocardia sp.]OJY50265.1 MAG: MarR family transcriptional regulator [Pseudonocardia sp. 73-21]
MTVPLPPAGAAFLLAQLGAHAAARYGERVAALDLTPAQTGLLRLVMTEPGLNQRDLATRLGVGASTAVALVDGLESRDLLERRRGPHDRRLHALHLTDAGTRAMAEVRTVAMDHDADMTAALDDDERRTLVALLRRVADQQGLPPGVHPGYRALRRQAR